mgnify:FL=1
MADLRISHKPLFPGSALVYHWAWIRAGIPGINGKPVTVCLFLKLTVMVKPHHFCAASRNPFVATQSPGRESGGAAVMEKAPERVHNDPVNSMEYVVTTLRQVVPSLSEQDAIAVMLEAHNTGVGLVIVCDLEPAEFYCETLKGKGLSSSLEPES